MTELKEFKDRGTGRNRKDSTTNGRRTSKEIKFLHPYKQNCPDYITQPGQFFLLNQQKLIKFYST